MYCLSQLGVFYFYCPGYRKPSDHTHDVFLEEQVSPRGSKSAASASVLPKPCAYCLCSLNVMACLGLVCFHTISYHSFIFYISVLHLPTVGSILLEIRET